MKNKITNGAILINNVANRALTATETEFGDSIDLFLVPCAAFSLESCE